MKSTKVTRVAVAAGLVVGSVVGGSVITGVGSAHAAPKSAAVTGGITEYVVKKVNLSIPLGSQANATTLATKSVPAGRYQVSAMIGLNTQPGSFIVCAIGTGTAGAPTPMYGTFANQWSVGAQENVAETDFVTVADGQTLQLTCDDNNGQSGDDVGEVYLDAIPVNTVH